MKIFFTGGTGFIGNLLITQLLRQGHEVTLLVRKRKKVRCAHEGLSILKGDATISNAWQERVGEQDVIFNLAGTSIFRRWSREVKSEIYNSRILTTRNIIEALKNSSKKGIRLFNASGVGYYGYHQDEILNESSPPGDSFLAKVARDWEAEALKARAMGIKILLCRFGIVLGREGGALKRTTPLFKCFLGGRWGGGSQWFSWIHERDVVGSLLFLLAHERIEGSVNLTAPNPVRNSELAHTLREVMRKRTILPTIPEYLIRGVLGEFSEVFLKGQRVFPQKLIESGYCFQFPTLKECLKNLLSFLFAFFTCVFYCYHYF